jgi:hypothetical protein
MEIQRITFLIVLVAGRMTASQAQTAGVAPLFLNEIPLDVSVTLPLRELKRSRSDSIYFPTGLHFKSGNDAWDSVQMGIRARGNFRRKHCYFPPLRIKIKKSEAKGSLFEGTKNLKLVVPCQATNNYDALILKEYLCYKLYERVTPYAFRTRLVALRLHDNGGKGKDHILRAFFIEDDDALAERLHGVAADDKTIRPQHLQDTGALRLDLFQYMIANTDFSTTFLHNIKVVQTNSHQKIPVPYDFDMAGLVSAPYATVDESLGIRNVRERYYKGFCRDAGLAEHVRREFIGLESQLQHVIDQEASVLDPKDLAGIKKQIHAFFDILKDDSIYRTNITLKCRER